MPDLNPSSPSPSPSPLDYQNPMPGRATSPALVLFAWLVVGLPAAWGVYETVMKSLPLFR